MDAELVHRFPNEATPAGSTLYYVCLFTPKAVRHDLAALFLFRHELEKLYAISDPGVARIKLQWWHQQLQLPLEQPSVHPLVKQVSHYYHRIENTPLFDELVASFDQRLHRLTIDDLHTYWQACQAMGGSFGQLINNLSNRPDNDEDAKNFGTAIQHTLWLQSLGKLMRHRLNLIPRCYLERHKLTAEQVLLSEHTVSVADLLTDLQQDIQSQFNLPVCKRGKSPLLKYHAITCRLTKLLEKENYDVMQQRIALTPLSKLWFAL